MRINSDDKVFDAIVSKIASENIEELSDYGENDPFTETDDFNQMMRDIYSLIKNEIKSDKPIKKLKFNQRFFIAASAIIVIILFFSFNVSAFKLFWYRTYVDIKGDILNIKTDTQSIEAQYDSITNFIMKDKIILPQWLPKGTELISVEDEADELFLTYKYDNQYIYLSEEIISDKIHNNSNEFFLENSKYKSKKINVNGMDITVFYLKGDTGNTSYTAVWNDGNIAYSMKGILSDIMFDAIISSLRYA